MTYFYSSFSSHEMFSEVIAIATRCRSVIHSTCHLAKCARIGAFYLTLLHTFALIYLEMQGKFYFARSQVVKVESRGKTCFIFQYLTSKPEVSKTAAWVYYSLQGL